MSVLSMKANQPDSPSERLLRHLDRVTETAPRQWLACCPAHDDKSPSLSIKECADGRVLAHCFSGCDIHEVLSAVGLDLADLFPDRITHHAEPASRRRYSQAQAALESLRVESAVVILAAETIGDGGFLDPCDLNRVRLAGERIRSASNLAGRVFE